FLRKTFLSYKANAEIIMTKLADLGTEIELEDARSIARVIRNVMWEWHLILGYALAFLVLYRIVLFFIDKSNKADFSSLSLHKKGVKISYYVIYATILFMTISGFAIYLQRALGLSEDMVKLIKELHEALYYVILIFVPLHIAGVIVADVKEEHGLISSMINGKTKENF
ncbi:MAG: cytochrome b/b6 domain-containing protein, partial [Campylobacterota bacterium]